MASEAAGRPMRIRAGWAALSVAVALVMASPVSVARQDETQAWMFKVYLDSKPIGYHEFRIRENGGSSTVDINARFDVKLLFFNALAYRHHNTETWDGKCLRWIHSGTTVNSKNQSVEARDLGPEFEVVTGSTRSLLDRNCVMSFAYWTRDILAADALLNAQTGELEPVTFRHEGEEMRIVDGKSVLSDRYTLSASSGDLSLWYARDTGLWLGLEAPARGGRTLRYEALMLPHAATQAAGVSTY